MRLTSRALIALILFAMAPAGVAHAGDSSADEAEFHFDRGNAAYRQAHFEDALEHYYASNRLVPNRNVEFNIARCLEQLGRHNEAFRAWSALGAQPGSADERKIIAEAIDRLRPHLALARIESSPPGAIIYVNRRDLGSLGRTPKTLALPAGDVRIILDLAGFRAVEVPLTTVRGKQVAVAPPLERIYGALELRHVPADAVVRLDFIDGEIIQHGPGRLRMLPGHKVLFVSAPGFDTARIETEVRPDDTTVLDVPLAAAPPPTGALVVRANIESSLVRVDGKEMGFTPTVIEGLPVGRHEVEISHDGRQPTTQSVDIKKSERTFMEVKLGRAEQEISAATKALVRAEDAPASISVITADEIAAFGWTTVAEALSSVRGAYSSSDRVYDAIGFRGFSPPGDYTNRVLVLIDGHPTNDITSGQGYVGHELDVDLATVERIEIVRGPGSVLYGSAALFGVVNIVTRRPQPGTHASAEGQVGSLGTQIGRLTGSTRSGNAEVWASAAGMRQTGESRFFVNDYTLAQDPPPAADRMQGPALNSDREKAVHADLGARIGKLTLRAGANDRTKLVPTQAYGNLEGTEYRDSRAFAELRWEHFFGATQLATRAAYDASRFSGMYRVADGPPLYDEFRAQWATGELRMTLPRFKGHQLIVGGEAQYQFDISLGSPSDDLPQKPATQLIASGYLVDDWSPFSRLRANVGVRADHYSGFGFTVNPRIAAIGRPYQGGNTKLLFGRAFRAPSVYERFYTDEEAQAPGETEGNHLKPETVLSAEVEHSHRVDDDLVLVASGFYNQLDRMLIMQAGADDMLRFTNAAGPVRGYGGEAELRWEPGGGDLVVFSCGLQRVEQRTDNADGSRTWDTFVNAPSSYTAMRVIHPLVGRALRFGTELVYDMGRHTRENIRVDDAMIANVTLSGEYRAWRLRYFAGVFNLFDVRGATTGYPVGDEFANSGPRFVTIPRYGRSARLGLAFTF